MTTPKTTPFTPGPWYLLPEHLRRHEVERLGTEDTTNVCTLSQTGTDTVYHAIASECSLANAHLIKAAPALYAVCRAIVTAWNRESEYAIFPGGAYRDDLRAALALVDGTQQEVTP